MAKPPSNVRHSQGRKAVSMKRLPNGDCEITTEDTSGRKTKVEVPLKAAKGFAKLLEAGPGATPAGGTRFADPDADTQEAEAEADPGCPACNGTGEIDGFLKGKVDCPNGCPRKVSP